MIKKGDQVVVAGESNEVFTVINFAKTGSPVLDNGFVEQAHKCTVIPEEYHDIIYSTKHRYIDSDIMIKIINDQEKK